MCDKTKCIVISYLPMFDYSNAQLGQDIAPSDLEKYDSPDVPVHAIGWGAEDGKTLAIFVVDEPAALAEHMRIWAEGDIQKWFTLIIEEGSEEPLVLLAPNVDESIRRFKLARFITGNPVPDDADYSVIFKPMAITLPNPHHLRLVQGDLGDKFGKETRVGFASLGAAQSGITEKDIVWLGDVQCISK